MQSNFTHLILMSLGDRITSPHLSHANHEEHFWFLCILVHMVWVITTLW